VCVCVCVFVCVCVCVYIYIFIYMREGCSSQCRRRRLNCLGISGLGINIGCLPQAGRELASGLLKSVQASIGGKKITPVLRVVDAVIRVEGLGKAPYSVSDRFTDCTRKGLYDRRMECTRRCIARSWNKTFYRRRSEFALIAPSVQFKDSLP
jgi:hypothetical protein